MAFLPDLQVISGETKDTQPQQLGRGSAPQFGVCCLGEPLRRLGAFEVIVIACSLATMLPANDSVEQAALSLADAAAVLGPQTTELDVPASSKVVYVSQERGSDTRGDGSATRPWSTLQKALSSLDKPDGEAVRKHSDTVIVARGRYAVRSLKLRPLTRLYGGFEPYSWARDVGRHETTLDGEEKGRVLEGRCEQLDGFTITGGRTRQHGAALLIEQGSMLITNNVFVDNVTIKPDGFDHSQQHQLAHEGGAIACVGEAAPSIQNNLFINNRTEVGNGGAVTFLRVTSADTRPFVAYNVFVDNVSGLGDDPHTRSSSGGAVSCTYGARPEIVNNLFLRNRALGNSDAGAVFAMHKAHPEVRNNWFVENQCYDDGGAVYVGSAAEPTLDGNVFAANSCIRGGPGGLRLSKQGRAIVTNNIFGPAQKRGAVACANSWMRFVNNTVVDNSDFGVHYDNGVAEMEPSVLMNNIIWGNHGPAFRVAEQAGGPPSVSHCNIEGEAPRQTNLDVDPKFLRDGVSLRVRYENALPGQTLVVVIDSRGESDHDPATPLAGRLLRVGEQWGVIAAGTMQVGSRLRVWGQFKERWASSREIECECPPTYRLSSTSPCKGLGAKR